jgi:hypothetical protein
MRHILIVVFLSLVTNTFAQYGLYQNCSLQNAQGQAISSASVYFLTQPANQSSLSPQARIFANSAGTGGPISQPVYTNGFGACSAYMAPGIYTVCYVRPSTGQICYIDQSVSPYSTYASGTVNACAYPGADGGAKFNSAVASLAGPGTILINPACGINWTTQAVFGPNQTAVFLGGTYTIAGFTLNVGDTIDGSNAATLQMPAYSTVSTAGMFTTYNGTTVASNDVIQNITLDGNWLNTPSANTCLYAQCRPALRIDNGSNATAVHDIHIQHATFQNWNNPAIELINNYPLPYNIWTEDSKFDHFGTHVWYSAGFDRNVFIRNNYFHDWGVGLTTSHANPIVTFDYTGYSGTSQFGMDISGNTFDPTTPPPDGYGFAAEVGAGGAGWVTGFTFENNTMKDGGTGNGGGLSGEFNGATIDGNVWSNNGPCELLGNNITVSGNTITNGTILVNPWYDIVSSASQISGNMINFIGREYTQCGNPNTVNQEGITVSGVGTVTSVALTQAIHQTAQTFTISSVTFTPQTNSSTPPEMVLNGTFSGGASNGYQNWGFTITGALNGGNDGNFICAASTGTTLTFVNPKGVTETSPGGATAVSSVNTTSYVGTYTNSSPGDDIGSFNGLVGEKQIAVTGFTNAGNNTNTTVTATAFSWSGGNLTITAANTYAANQPVIIHSTFPDPLYLLNGLQFTVLASGLSTSQFLIAEPSVGGSGSTDATFTVPPLSTFANSLTAMAVYNPSGVNETHAGALSIAPSSYNANIGPDNINMGVSSGSCAGVFLGFGNDGQGSIYDVTVHDVTVSGLSGANIPCFGIDVLTGTMTPESSGFTLQDNIFTNIGIGIGLAAPVGSFQDVTAARNKFINTVSTIDVPNVPVGYRARDNVTTDTQTEQHKPIQRKQ